MAAAIQGSLDLSNLITCSPVTTDSRSSPFKQGQLVQPALCSQVPLGSSDRHQAEKRGWLVGDIRTGPSLLGLSVQAVASCFWVTLQEDQH